MGAGSSKNFSEIDSQAIVDVVTDQSIKNKINESCSTGNMQSNELNISNSTIKNLTANQTNYMKNMCVLSTILSNSSKAANESDLINKITEQLESKGGTILGGDSSNTSISKLFTTVKLNTDQSQLNDIMKSCFNDTEQKNIIDIINSNVSDSTINQANNKIFECITSHVQSSDMSSDNKNAIKNEADKAMKSEGGKDPLSTMLDSLFTGLAGNYAISIGLSICVVCVICMILVGLLMIPQ